MTRLFQFLFLFCLSSSAFAESYVYLTNNTYETLQIETHVRGDTTLVAGEHYEQLAAEVPPLATRRVLRMNRDEGIKNGKTYFLDTRVSGSQSQVTLQQKLTGTLTFSKMWLSAASDSGDLTWFYDRDIHRQTLTFDGKQSTLAFRSQKARTSGDDLYYVIHNEHQQPTVQSSDKLKVLSYNTWILLPGLIAKKSAERLDAMLDIVSGYDVIVFQELFDNSLRQNFINRLDEEYPYFTRIVDETGKMEDGGIFIASRWPIEAEDQTVYDRCINDGCLAAKGAVYAKVNKMGNSYHLFGTHTHAYTGTEDIAVRAEHLQQLRDFIDSQNIPTSEPVLIAGDLNVDKVNYPGEHSQMLAILDATEPQATGAYPYSYDGHVNKWASNYREYLDYVLYSNRHLQPVNSTNALLTPRSIDAGLWGDWDISDHFPIEGSFTFPLPSKAPVESDGYRTITMSDLCLDGNSVINLAHTSLEACDGTDSQYWQFTAEGSIRNRENPNRCLDGMGVLNGTRLIVWDCHGGDNQRWMKDGKFIRSSQNPQKVIDAYQTSQGGGVGIWQYHGGNNQQWQWRQ
ncbi:hypothetical protein GCM10023116_27840 [Kistimonas scapharcae]|uniref:Ricin B lectin domain-containing protein n=1 Tax=Kistimonas scapharcae TaxID=1036133 RepID=A0ABP8V3J9_9GAMM